MSALTIFSGGAAHGLVKSLAPAFKAQTGLDIEGEFSAVGAMADRLREGKPCDIIVLSASLIATLARENLVVSDSISDVGLVETAMAVRAGDPKVSATDAASLRATFLDADAIFVPDTTNSTAGIHVAKVLQKLGIADEVASRLKIYPNGATAMRHLAESDAKRPVGCTQSTEIISTDGVNLSGSLPPGYELATMYTAAVATKAANPGPAKTLIGLLSGAGQASQRERAGFLDAKK